MQLTSAQRHGLSDKAAVGKRAAENRRLTAFICYFVMKYPKLPFVKETSMRRFKNLSIAKVKRKGASNEASVSCSQGKSPSAKILSHIDW